MSVHSLLSSFRSLVSKGISQKAVHAAQGDTAKSPELIEYERMINNGKGKVDDAMEDPDVAKLYMAQSIPYLFDVLHDKRAVFDELWSVYRNPVTHLRDPIRLVQFMTLLEIANDAPEGDYLEVGTFQGESARLIYKLMDPSRTLFCLDTYEGFVAEDLEAEREVCPSHTWTVGNFLETSVELVGRNIGDGKKPDNVELVKGWFPESFHEAGLDDRKWRFVHLDMDLYEPTRAGLEILWKNVVPGGVMVFHDYENLSFPGVKVAVDKFFRDRGLLVTRLGDLWGSAMIVKPLRPDVGFE